MTVNNNIFKQWIVPHGKAPHPMVQLEGYAEQVRVDTQSYSRFSHINETPVQYQSTENSRPFDCPTYTLDPSKVVVRYDDINNEGMREFFSEREIRFPVHPANEAAPQIEEVKASKKGESIQVFPTASTRTVRIWNPSRRDGLKLDLHLRISRFDRRLGPGTIRHSVEVSKRLASYLSNSNDPHTAMMREDFGAAFITERAPKLKGWGFLHRDMNPFPRLSKNTYSVPLFSLYGKDPANLERDPMLAQILDPLETNGERMQAVLNHVFFPIIRSWTSVFQNTGIILEPHGQNSRIEFTKERGQLKLTGRIVHLDFDAAVHQKKVEELGQDAEVFYEGQLITSEDGHEMSTIFDKSVGKMLFDQIATFLKNRYAIDPKILHQKCQTEFAKCFPNFAEYLPEKTYRYEDQPIGDNAFGYVCTGESPVWRPAKQTDNIV